MGNYVDQSDCTDMKEFYHAHIAPYANNEIKMNDIYLALQQIDNEQLRAFLYYKMMLGVSNQIVMNISLLIEKRLELNQMKLTDLIRVLGILIDNAIEEVKRLKEGEVTIEIINLEHEVNFQIRNTVDTYAEKKGITAGNSTKGLGRGNGLVIVNSILSNYENIILNGYFKNGYFIQSLQIFELS